MQDRAPSASARIMSAPVRTPESNITSISEPTASTTRGSAEIADGAPSSWRPPWFDTLMASAPVVTAILASSTSRMPLRISLPGHRLLTHSTSFQRKRRVELARGPCASELMFVVSFTWPARLPKVLLLPLRIDSAQAGLVMMSITFLILISGGTVRPLRTSSWRWPST